MNKTKVVNVRFTEEEVSKFKEIAERDKRSLSSVVRLLSLKNLELKKENVIDMTSLQNLYNGWREVTEEGIKNLGGSTCCGEQVVREDFTNYADLKKEITFEEMSELEKEYNKNN